MLSDRSRILFRTRGTPQHVFGMYFLPQTRNIARVLLEKQKKNASSSSSWTQRQPQVAVPGKFIGDSFSPLSL
jgi:hypothetical protein